MSPVLLVVLTAPVAYLIGAIPFGYLVARWRGVDIFAQGSGNIGATNVARVLGRAFGVLVFVLDFAKGALTTAAAFWLAKAAAALQGSPLGPHDLPVAAGLSAFLGHLFPIYLRFRGGKGVATGAGVVAVLLPLPALVAFGVWIAVLCAYRYVSLASLTAALTFCLVCLGTVAEPFGPEHATLTVFALAATGLVFARHRGNIQRLLQGNENRLRDGPLMLTLTKSLHVLAVGLWFGSVCFFTIAGVLLFSAFDQLSNRPASARPYWLPLPQELDQAPPSASFPEPLRKEQGSRLFGAAVGALFASYFALQGFCGLLAIATALSWSRTHHEGVHRLRLALLALGLVAVAVGWSLQRELNTMRNQRYQASDAVLTSKVPVPDTLLAKAEAARAEFGKWHGVSLLVNFLTLILATIVMALAAQMPAAEASEPAPTSRNGETPAGAALLRGSEPPSPV